MAGDGKSSPTCRYLVECMRLELGRGIVGTCLLEC